MCLEEPSRRIVVEVVAPAPAETLEPVAAEESLSAPQPEPQPQPQS